MACELLHQLPLASGTLAEEREREKEKRKRKRKRERRKSRKKLPVNGECELVREDETDESNNSREKMCLAKLLGEEVEDTSC